MPIKITEVKAKSILNRSKISDYTLNCYIGCQHACNYCYAKYMSFYTGHIDLWGTFVDVKINAPEILEKDMKKGRGRIGGEVMMSSVCDGWQPIEAKYKLSRSCLNILLKNNFHVSILTKNKLILRDFDILRKYRNRVDLGVTITTFSYKMQRALEPFCSTSQERLNIIREANKAGINTWVFLGPLIPGFTGTFNNIRDIFNKLYKLELDKIYIDDFHYYKSHFWSLKKSIGRAYPLRFKAFLSPLNYKKGSLNYGGNLRDNIQKAANLYHLKNVHILF